MFNLSQLICFNKSIASILTSMPIKQTSIGHNTCEMTGYMTKHANVWIVYHDKQNTAIIGHTRLKCQYFDTQA